MHQGPDGDFAATCQRVLAELALVWERPELEHTVTVELSRRMHRALGRTLPARRLVRIASTVARSSEHALVEVLCHEIAHVAVYERHGRAVRPHGREWAALMRSAGFEPRVRVDPRALGIEVASAPVLRGAGRRTAYVYEHRCSVCQRQWTARRTAWQWRCAACVGAGLEGVLEVRRYRVDRGAAP